MKVFSGRLQAIGEANSMLRQENWQNASLDALVKSAVTPFVDLSTRRIKLSGPQLFLQGDVVLPLCMALHELCTNAVKYGAGDRLELTWQESGGPTVVTPQRRGFGSSVIEQVLSFHTDGEVELLYDPAGLVCRISVPAKKALAYDEPQE